MSASLGWTAVIVSDLSKDELLTLLWLGILGAAAVYLIWLGAICLVVPDRARAFLGKFAMTDRANLIEAGARFVVGLAFIGSSERLGGLLAVIGGLFLIVSAALFLIFPAQHRRIAARTVPPVLKHMAPLGLSSILIGLVLLLAIAFAAQPPY